MGKRVDFSARCVITPDAYFECDRVGVPEKIALVLTVPEKVTNGNIHKLRSSSTTARPASAARAT